MKPPSPHPFGFAESEPPLRGSPEANKRVRGLQQAGLLTAIPFVLLVGPAFGYYLGTALDRRWSHAPWGLGAGLLFGLAASGKVTIQLIQQAQQLNRRD